MRTLGPESKAERKLREVQESCLDRAFHISMDRVNYRASDSSELQAEQKEVLQEIRELENPEASPFLAFLNAAETLSAPLKKYCRPTE